MCPGRPRMQAPPAGPRACSSRMLIPGFLPSCPQGIPRQAGLPPFHRGGNRLLETGDSEGCSAGKWQSHRANQGSLVSKASAGIPGSSAARSLVQERQLRLLAKGEPPVTPPSCRGGREAAGLTFSRGGCLMLGVRKGLRVNKGFLPSPHPSLVPSPRPAAGAGTTFCPQTRCPGRKPI